MLRSGSICVNLLYNYLSTNIDNLVNDDNSPNSNKEIEKRNIKLKTISKTFENYGGILSKLAQILSSNNPTSNIFDECKPFSSEKTTEYIKQQNMSNVFIDYNIFKSGSIGQVYLGEYNNKKIAIKVQYVGLEEQTKLDVNMLEFIIKYLYNFNDMTNAILDIKKRLNEELDYDTERKNQKIMYNLYRNGKDGIVIPKIIDVLCCNKIIAMDYVEGKNFNDFIRTGTQEQKNDIAFKLVKFIFKNIYVNKIFYTDIHYGNFLIKDDLSLCILDFGCIQLLDDELCNNLKLLYKSIKNKNQEQFFSIVKQLNIIDDNISDKSKEYMYNYFTIQYEPWISNNFQFTEEWLDKTTDKDFELMKEWKLPQNIIFFNKIPYGLIHLLTKLNACGYGYGNLMDELVM